MSLAAAAVVALAACPAGGAQDVPWDWGKEMFDHLSHDFGVVARGAKVEHVFTLENIWVEDVHIEGVTSSCKCTSAVVSKDYLKTWEKAKITAVVDTRSVPGSKVATLKVALDKPFRQEIQLHVYALIRGDVVVQPPGVVQFGSVAEGAGGRQKVSVSYAGRHDWRILKVESANPSLSGQAIETQRTADQVTYDLIVDLSASAPPGYVQDYVTLVTNDREAESVPVPVEGIVTSAITVRPSPLMLGMVEVKQAVTRQLVIQGKTPFRVVGLRCDDPQFKLTVPLLANTMQLIPVTFKATQTTGKVSSMIHIQTDQGAGSSLDVPVQVQVVPEHPAAAEGTPEKAGREDATRPAGSTRPEESTPPDGSTRHQDGPRHESGTP